MEIPEDVLDCCIETFVPSYVDLRSPEKAANRLRKQKQKYYAYRGVHPSWVGQQYYTLTLVSEEPVRLSRTRKRKHVHTTAVVEPEHETILDDLLSRQDSLTTMMTAPSIHHAIAEARATGHNATHTENNTDTYSADYAIATTLEAPTSLTQLAGYWQHNAYFQSVPALPNPDHPTHVNMNLKLKLKTWTKRDNFEQKTYFSSGPDTRHSRGRRIRRDYTQRWENRMVERAMLRRGLRDNAIETPSDVEAMDICDCGCDWREWLDNWEELKDLVEGEDGTARVCETTSAYHWWSGALDREMEVEGESNTEQETTDERSEVFSVLESLLSSSEIVVVSRSQSQSYVDWDDDGGSVGLNDISDLVGALDEVEWDVVSDTGWSESAPVTGAEI